MSAKKWSVKIACVGSDGAVCGKCGYWHSGECHVVWSDTLAGAVEVVLKLVDPKHPVTLLEIKEAL